MARAPEVGDSLGRYQLTEELGRGGMAVVYRAEDPSLGREVAIKVMHAHMWGKAEYAARFAREARAVAALRHPNIVEIYDYGEGSEEEGELPGYIISEYVRGPTLREFIDSRGTPLPEVSVMVALKLAQALDCAHESGIVHRDLKPENVIIAEKGRVVLTDFGIARISEGEAVTQTGAMVGSPAYMSPEQARGRKVDARSDLFSLGVVLYLLCTGKLPFSGQDPISTVLSILEGKYDPPMKHNPQVGGRIERVIKRLLKVEQEERYQSAQEVIEALVRILDEAAVEEVDEELATYFDAPGSYNEGLISRVLERSLLLAEEASETGDYASALSFCDRVLAFEPDHPRALELMARLTAGSSPRMITIVAVGLAVLLGLVGAGVFWYLQRDDPARRLAPPVALDAASDLAPLEMGALDQAAPPLDAASPDASPQETRPHPRIIRPRRRRDASVLSAVSRPDVRVLSPRPDARPAPTHGRLKVTLGPFCRLTLDGKPIGTSPMKEGQALKVTPGRHVLICRTPQGVSTRRNVVIKAGQRTTVSGLIVERITVRLKLVAGEAVRIEGKTYRGTFQIAPQRRRVDLLKGGQVVQGKGAYVTFPLRACTLVDQPRLSCR